MTREEYYRQRRIYRKLKACFTHPAFIGVHQNDDDINADVYMAYYLALHSFPDIVKESEPQLVISVTLNDHLFNVRHLPNSYPHKTRNP